MSTQPRPVDSVRRLLGAVDAKAARLASDFHPAWVDAAWARLGPQMAGLTQRVPVRRHSMLLAGAYGIVWPELDAFREPAHRIALLDRSRLMKVLAACAIDARRESVRRSVGRTVRELLIEGIGESAYQQVLDSPLRGIKSADPLAAMEVGQDRLAVDGFKALCAQGAWRDQTLISIVRLSLQPAAFGDPGQGDERSRVSTGRGVDRTVDRLHHYFPELAWLFGSDMDRALSASKTASSVAQTSLH
jgi:hypothetical protein